MKFSIILFFLHLNLLNSQSCSNNCASCSSPTVCTNCDSGYFVDSSKSCTGKFHQSKFKPATTSQPAQVAQMKTKAPVRTAKPATNY